MKIINKRSVTRMILVLLAMALLSGCVPKMYSESQEEALVSSCLPAIEEFLADRYGEYELGEFHLQKGLIEPEKPLFGNYGSNVVRGSYTVDGNSWDLVYDSETGEFYTSELMEKLKQQESARILDYLEEGLPEEDLREFRVTVLDLYYLVQSHDIVIDNHKNTADTYVYISSVLPAGISAEDLPAFAERGFDGGIVSNMRCHYYSDRKNALTDEAFQSFFADNLAYQVRQYLLIENDNPSAVEESTSGSEADAEDVQESTEGTAGKEESTQETVVWFRPEPVVEDADCRIEYENGAALARRPYFTESGGEVTMQFNGIDWYRVRVIRREDAEKYFPDEKMLAESSNLKVFRSYGNQTYAYSCLFDPSDSSRDVFLFETDTSPEADDFGFGFGDYIHYYTDGKEVFPDTGLDRSALENNGTERSVPAGTLSEEAIHGNGGHFVRYEDRIFFRVPGGDSMRTPALWGLYDEIPEDRIGRIMALDPETMDSEVLFEDVSHGPIAISGGRLILSGNEKSGMQPVRSAALDGSNQRELPGTYLYGTLPSGRYFITGGYEASDHKLHFYICSEDGSFCEAVSSEPLYDYAGLGEGQLFCITGGEGSCGILAGYDLETGKETVYGPLPEISDLADRPGEAEQLYTEDGYVWLQLSAYEGTGHYYAGSRYVRAKCSRPDSLEEVFPEGMRGQEDTEGPPAVTLKDGELVFAEGIPNTAEVDAGGNLGVYDENGTFVPIASGYGITEDEIDGTRMRTELCELVDGDIYLVRNSEWRAPDADIGWREAYQRRQTWVMRVDGTTGESETIGYSINPEMNSGDMDSGVEEARELVESLKEVWERMEKGMKLRYGDPRTVDGILMDVFELGTERKGQFAREYLYAADTVSGTVYRYNASRNVWDQVMTEDLTAGTNAPSGDPLRGLVAEDILTRFRAAQPVIRNNGVREEAYRLGVWVRDSIGMDRLPAAVSVRGKQIGQKYEFWFGTDISNNLDSNFPKIYEAYFTLKDYYTSGGNIPFYEEVSDENDFFGNGDPETIRMMYKDMQEFITACNNTIRKK